jgi:hypothetical protein
MGETDEASAIIEQVAPRITELAGPAGEKDLDRAVEANSFLLDQAVLAFTRDDQLAGTKLLRTALDRFSTLVMKQPDSRYGLTGMARAVYLHWKYLGTLPPEADALPSGFLSGLDDTENCYDVDLAARLALASGDREKARRQTELVLSKGYYRPGFIEFCREYALCEQN